MCDSTTKSVICRLVPVVTVGYQSVASTDMRFTLLNELLVYLFTN